MSRFVYFLLTTTLNFCFFLLSAFVCTTTQNVMNIMGQCRYWLASLSASSKNQQRRRLEQEILLDCDQSNVLLARIIFFCILLGAFSFLSVGIRDPASN